MNIFKMLIIFGAAFPLVGLSSEAATARVRHTARTHLYHGHPRFYGRDAGGAALAGVALGLIGAGIAGAPDGYGYGGYGYGARGYGGYGGGYYGPGYGYYGY